MLAGIRDILVISTPADLPNFERLLGDGSRFGVSLSYAEQPSPDGLAQAFLIGEELHRRRAAARWCWATTSSTATACPRPPEAAPSRGAEREGGATVFGYHVDDPERFGVVEFDAELQRRLHRGEARAPQEQLRRDGPVLLRQPRVRDGQAGEAERAGRAGDHRPQPDVPGGRHALNGGDRWAAATRGWIPAPWRASTRPASSCAASSARRTCPISVPEEIAYENGWVGRDALAEAAERYGKSAYGRHLRAVADGLVSSRED